MTTDWEETFRSWASPPSKTQQEKGQNAERAVSAAVASGTALNSRTVRVLTQGSYRNRTNVRLESDVDLCVLCSDSLFSDVPEGMSVQDFGLTSPAAYSYEQYRNDVESVLVDRFGRHSVKRGGKAFDIHENSYRIDADVAACFEHRRYQRDGSYLTGTAFLTEQGTRIVNWPEQHYANGVAKNQATERRFKAVVRILKRLCNAMVEDRVEAAISIPSFLLECLVWNVPNEGFGHDAYREDVRWALAHLWNNTRTDAGCREWGEINELKYLFWSGQPWTRVQVNAFLQAAWDYAGYR